MSSLLSPQLKRLLAYVRPYGFRLGVGVVLVAFVALAEGAVAFMLKLAVDFVLKPSVNVSSLPLFTIPHGRTIFLNEFFPASIHNVWTIFAFSLLTLYVAKALAEYLGTTQIQYVGQAAVTNLRNQVYSRVIRQPIGFFQVNATGRLISGVIEGVERTRLALSEYLADLFQKGFTLLVFIFVLFYLNWRMALGAAVLLPLVILPVNKFGRKIRRSAENSQTGLSDLSQILQETISGNRVVKAFGMEDFEVRKFRETARRLLRENMRWVRAAVITSPIMDLLGAIVVPLLLLYARDQIRAHAMTEGDFFAFIFALFNAYMPLKRMGYVYQQFQGAQGASTQVFAYLDQEEEQLEQPGAKFLSPFSREIEFEDVSFVYEANSAVILQNIGLTARKGEVIALVGSSGAGKTTLVNLLPRFYEITSGAIRIDGVDIRDVTIRSLREQIAMVAQENILFYDTVWNNISYGLADVPQEKVIAAARAALAQDFIMELPQGYDTVIGERGTRLSGGQRQRIAIARAILKDSPILILDEATSELDAESEMLVQKALANLMVGRTTFVIAHRLATVRRADKILVLEEGQIRESGTHAELLAHAGTYARLHGLQFADEDLVAAPQTAPPNLTVSSDLS
ncbi:MAG TPA: ABC transporter ATP-binding protein [Candidatus Dormibacteraeota bacterium]|nr:ABC transporter ATP-binding protein [Candidatus Dormibacteraeota bacterium]